MQTPSVLKRAVALVASMCFFAAQVPAAETIRLRWNELTPLVNGKRVRLTLNGAVRVAGTVHDVESTGLKVEVTKTSDRRTYPKGLATIPRSSVSTIQLNKSATHKGIIIGGAVGGGIGAAAGWGLSALVHNEGGTVDEGVIAAAIVLPIAIGLLIGQLFDSIANRGGTRIIIVND